VTDLDFQAFDVIQLDRMVKRITDWYGRLATQILLSTVWADTP
jgi:hypothetical protein